MKGKFTSKTIYGCSTKGNPLWKEYKTWQRIINKCHNPNNHRFNNYGARGIVVDDIYRYSFLNFLNEIGECPLPKREYSIERIDNDGNYTTGNMIWLKSSLQALNKSNTRMVEYRGKKIPFYVLCKDLNINYTTASTRFMRGVSLKDIITNKKLKYTRMEVVYKGEVIRLGALAKQLNLNYDRCTRLYNQGYTGDEIAANPISKYFKHPVLHICNGKKLTVTHWAKVLNISRTTIDNKLKKGLTMQFIHDIYLERGRA